MVELVGEDQAVGQQPADCRDRRLVGDEARGEDEAGFLAVQIGELMFEGERQTWPRIEMIRISSLISRRLDDILARAGAGSG